MSTTKDPIRDLIEKSGNNFHYQVVNFLRQKDWFVSISPYYNDNMGNKSREIDIVAERQFDIKNCFGKDNGAVFVRLFIECKFINKPVVFWFDEINKDMVIKKIIEITWLNPEDTLIKTHHYFKNNQVAKLFTSSPDKISDNELIYKAFIQSLNAMLYYRSNNSIIPKGNLKPNIKKKLEYPIIICDSFKNFFKANSEDKRGYLELDDNFQLEVNYAYLDETRYVTNGYFLVDVIDFGKLDNFLKELEETDIKIIRDRNQ